MTERDKHGGSPNLIFGNSPSASVQDHGVEQVCRTGDATYGIFKQALSALNEMGDQRIAEPLLGLALVSRTMQQGKRAVRLLAAIDTLLTALGSRLEIDARNEYENTVTELRSEHGAEQFAVAWAEGQALTSEQVIAYALALVE